MKYKTRNVFDDMEDANSYIEINSDKGNVVEGSFNDLTIDVAMNKFFYPRFKPLFDNEKRIEDIINEKNSNMPQKPKRKLVALRVILETLLSVGLGCAGGFVYFLLSSSLIMGPAIIASGIFTVVFGSIVGIIDHIAYRKRVKKKNDEAIDLNNELLEVVKVDKELIEIVINAMNDFKKQVDLNKKIAIDDIGRVQDSVIKFNKKIYRIVNRLYNVADGKNETLVNLVEKYQYAYNSFKDSNDISNDYNMLKKILPNLPVYVPQIIDKESTNMVYSFREDEAKLLIKTIIAFAQVLNVTYGKVFENFKDAQRKEEERILQDKMRKKEEERIRLEKEQEEEKLRTKLAKEKFEKENSQYKRFFDEFGLDEELDQDELTK